MSHTIGDLFHTVTDDDGIFNINPSTREITYERAGGVDYFGGPVLVKGDHNSERLTFKIPMVIEGHDMSTCNLIRVHYITIDSATSAQYKDAYDIPLSDRSNIGDDYFSFNWLVDRNVTKSAGQVSFVIQFACTRETTRNETVTDAESGKTTVVEKTISIIDYSWSTIPYSELRVSEGYINDKQDAEDFEDEYSSIVNGWYDEIKTAIARSDASKIKSVTTETSDEDKGENKVTFIFGDNSKTELVVQNGSKGSTGLSAFEIAKKKDPTLESEEDWLNSLKAAGYEDCLKGEVLTEEEYEAKVNAGSIEEGFAYIIKSETLHADTATSAAGYTEDGAIATAISEINKALDDKARSDHTHDEYASAEPVSETGSASVTYTCSTNNGDSSNSSILDPIIIYVGNDDGEDTVTHTFTIKNNNDFTVTCDWEAGDYGEGNRVTIAANSSNTFTASSSLSSCNIKAQFIYGDVTSNVISREFDGVANFEVNANPVTVDIADGLVCVHAEITSCSLTGATYNVMVSSDGKKLTFTLSGYTSEYTSGGEHKATLEYTYTTVRPGYKSIIADHLSLTQSAIEDIPGRGTYTSGESIPDRQVYVSPGRAYLLVRHPHRGTSPRYFETAMLYVDNNVVPANTPPPCLSTPFSNGSRVVVYQSESDGLWYAYGIDSEGNYTKIPYVAFIEL